MTADQVTNYMKGNEIHVQMSRFNYFTYPDVSLSMKMCAQMKAGRWSLTWRHLTWLALSFLRRISAASETDETLTRLTQSTHVYVCHAISHSCLMGRFPILTFNFSPIKFCFKPRRTLNGSQEMLLGSFLWLDVSSNKITKGKLNFHSRFPPS